MNSGDVPSKFPIPFGASAGAGYIRNIPLASQIGVHDGWASLTDGFPPLCFDPVEAGGVPPFGQDFNGILKLLSQWDQWASAGAPIVYDNSFATAVGGYPKGALLMSATLNFLWLNLVDGNTANPDAGGANWVRASRIRLTANTNFYVSTTGSDTNDGLTTGTAWATLQHAWDFIQSAYDLYGFTATINVAAGTYTAGIEGRGQIVGQRGPATVVFQGDLATPSNVVINVANGIGFQANLQSAFTVQGFKFTGSGATQDLTANEGGLIRFTNVDFGSVGTSGVHIGSASGGIVECFGPYTISGGAAYHLSCSAAVIRYPQAGSHAITLTGTPAFSVTFASVQTVGAMQGPVSGVTTFTGAATGKRYDVTANGVINTSGGGASYLPGNTSGTTATGGQYI